ncbi:Ribonuclease H-like protein [Dioscorea alata]|uniref:Ribonuclease H-like protein n=1 Tax=Dioscorea alata TaxID=55571 RepID=A0ACB7URJ0_DIOAL|nr:Ribonuclease H-like protein [Dioscorea alata]
MVWQHFKKNKVGDKAECNYCKKLLGGDSKNGTRHLHDHHKVCKMRPFNNIRQKTLVQQQWKADGKMCVSNYTFDQESSRKDLASMIITHEYPISMVEHHGFKKYSANLQPLFKIPSRNTIKKDIMKMYANEKSKIIDLLKKNLSKVAITTDMWTASNQKKGFMAITGHFIDNNWNLQSLVLRFVYVPCPHTSAALSKELLKCIFDWNIERKLSTLTVDNCTTNDAMVDILVSKLNPNHLLLHGKLIHRCCCAHILNLIVQDGLKLIGDGIERVRDSVAFWTATPKELQTFKENVQILNINYSKQLMLDCKTRWNSTYLMLSVALEYKDVFYRLQQTDPHFISTPTEEDWMLAKEICKRLQVFLYRFKCIFGEKISHIQCFLSIDV